MDSPFTLLRSLPLFASLHDAEAQSLARTAHVASWGRDVVIFREGEQGDGFYLLITGLVKIRHLTPDGREAVLHLIRAGNMFGEAAVFQDGTYPADAVSMADSVTLFLPAAPLTALIAANPGLALRLLGAFSLRMRMFTRKLESLNTRDATQRLAGYLIHRSRLQGDEDEIGLDVSREVLAALLGTARETVSRSLHRFAEAGLVELHGRRVRILQRDRLQQYADGLRSGEPSR